MVNETDVKATGLSIDDGDELFNESASGFVKALSVSDKGAYIAQHICEMAQWVEVLQQRTVQTCKHFVLSVPVRDTPVARLLCSDKQIVLWTGARNRKRDGLVEAEFLAKTNNTVKIEKFQDH